MAAIVSTDFRVLNANNFKEDVADASNHVYIGIGKADVWSTTLSDRTDSTDISGEFPPNDHLDEFGIARQNLIAIKKVNSSDISHVVRRYNWTTNRAYVAWDSNDSSIFDKEFYILTSEFKVYKCIVKGSGNSTIQPTQTLTSPTAESDGYVWKYMYTISVADSEKFLTNTYMPVKTVSFIDADTGAEYINNTAAQNDLSEADYAQYLNQKASRDTYTHNSVDAAGGIERIVVTNGGTFSSGSSAPTVTITGDGSGATATATMNSGGTAVESITVTTKGNHYTVADITFSAGDAAARAVLAPQQGHGVDPVAELGAFYVGVNTQLDVDDTDITQGNDFRQVTLIKNPLAYDATSYNGAAFTAATGKATRHLLMNSSTANYQVDELLQQTRSDNRIARAFLLEKDDSANKLFYYQNELTGYVPFEDSASLAVVGQTSNTSATMHASNTRINPGEIDNKSGDILFLENRAPINRSANQIEDIKLIIEF